MNRRPTLTPESQRLCQECRLCNKISNFPCAWLTGFGNESDRPNLTSCLVTAKMINNQWWVQAIETADNRIQVAKDLIMDTSLKLGLLPIMVFNCHSKYPNEEPDLYIFDKSQTINYGHLIGKSLGFLDNCKRLEIFLSIKKEKTNKQKQKIKDLQQL